MDLHSYDSDIVMIQVRDLPRFYIKPLISRASDDAHSDHEELNSSSSMQLSVAAAGVPCAASCAALQWSGVRSCSRCSFPRHLAVHFGTYTYRH